MEQKEENKKESQKEFRHPETGEIISKSAYKAYLKQKEKEKKEAEKKAKKEEKAKIDENKQKKKKNEDEEELDPTKYYENRKNWILSEKAKGNNPYPHKFKVTISLPAFIKKYESITKKGEWLSGHSPLNEEQYTVFPGTVKAKFSAAMQHLGLNSPVLFIA